MNQTPEQIARDQIDALLEAAGWVVQSKNKADIHAGLGVAVREYQTDIGPVDYALFVDKQAVGIIEAKRAEEGVHFVVHEDQAQGYANAKLKYVNNTRLPFVYESTGTITQFTDNRDPFPQPREVFGFHRPETFQRWLKETKTLRGRFHDMPLLDTQGLRDCQITAITKLETSFKQQKIKALIQMATGSGKTFTAITAIYRLLKYADAKRILFLVDTKNLGEQAEQEFMSYMPNDSNRKFTELYGVHRLKSSAIPKDNQVYISTIQRFYSILQGKELEESAEEQNPNEINWQKREPQPVVYNSGIPIEFFDCIIVDECHRSIYNLWKQVLDYFDSFLIGLTATPDNHTFGFFNQNIVSEYTHEKAVADGVNVGFDVFHIETEVSQQGGTVWKGDFVDHREKLTRKKRWAQTDEDIAYTNRQLDEKVVNPNQIRLIIQTFKENMPHIFPERFDKDGQYELPKTLIFAKTDSHADDIIKIIRDEYGLGADFCKKITYTADDSKGALAKFRNSYYPRIAVTVDMIATGTDVKALEVLLFMRDVKSRNYFEQMKGRGTRTIHFDDLKKVSPSAKSAKDHFVIVDAIGVTKSLKTDSRPLEKKHGVAFKDLLGAIKFGVRDEPLFSSLAGRLARLNQQMTEKEQAVFAEKAKGRSVATVVNDLLRAFHPDAQEEIQTAVNARMPGAAPQDIGQAVETELKNLADHAAAVFNGDLCDYLENVRKVHEQIIDHITPDALLNAGWEKDSQEKATETLKNFDGWLQSHRDTLTALQIFYDQPYRRREVTYRMIREVFEILQTERPALAPLRVWQAYAVLDKTKESPQNELIALVSLLRHCCGMDAELALFDKTVERNFQTWVFQKQSGALKFNEAQMQWLRLMRDHIARSFHVEKDDFDLSPFDSLGGLGRMWQLFGAQTDALIEEVNAALVA